MTTVKHVTSQRPHANQSRGCCGSVGKLMGRTVNTLNPTRILAIGLCVMICIAIFSRSVSGAQATGKLAKGKVKASHPPRVNILTRLEWSSAHLARVCDQVFVKNRHLMAIPDTNGASVTENAQRFIRDIAAQTHRKFAKQERYTYGAMEGHLSSTSSPDFWKGLASHMPHPSSDWTAMMGSRSFVVNPERNVLSSIPGIMDAYPTISNISVVLFRDHSTFPSDQLILVRQDSRGMEALDTIIRHVSRDHFFSDSHITERDGVVVLDPTVIRSFLQTEEGPTSLIDGPFMVTRPVRMPCSIGKEAGDVEDIALAAPQFWGSWPITRENMTELNKIGAYTLPPSIIAEALEDRDY